jgi:hypothetical protein
MEKHENWVIFQILKKLGLSSGKVQRHLTWHELVERMRGF